MAKLLCIIDLTTVVEWSVKMPCTKYRSLGAVWNEMHILYVSWLLVVD